MAAVAIARLDLDAAGLRRGASRGKDADAGLGHGSRRSFANGRGQGLWHGPLGSARLGSPV